MSNKKSLSVKTVSILLVLVLLVGLAAGGTIAWLIDASEQVVNTFTYGDINIDLEETDNGLDQDNNPKTNTYKMIPGKTLEKNPWVTVMEGSEPNWLFVELKEVGGAGEWTFDHYLEYAIADGWTALGDAYPGVYYRDVETYTEDQIFGVLKDNQVKVKETVTKEMVNALDEIEPATYPQLIITAYSVQKENMATAEAAWKAVGEQGVTPDAAPTYVSDAAALQAALDNGDKNIVLAADITGNVTVAQKPDLRQTIDGNGKNFAGVITVDGKSGTYTTAAVTIKSVNFKADSISADACIQLGDGTNATRYTCNVTVDNCTFDVPGAVGVKSYTGGDKNLVITNCTATADTHSLVQAKGIDGILVEGCEVYSKNGLNFNNSDNVTVEGCKVEVKGYAVRFGESSGGVGAAETYLIKDSSLTSDGTEGDPVIVLRGTADYATLTIVNTTITGTPDIANTATGATVVK